MKPSKHKKLESAGWKVGSAAEFLGLTDEEVVLVEMKISLAANLKSRRLKLSLTQQELAEQIGSSQSRVAKMETADSSVSMELLVRTLVLMGASRKEIGGIIGARRIA